jgi:DNA-binding transcriptional LysR family regulator
MSAVLNPVPAIRLAGATPRLRLLEAVPEAPTPGEITPRMLHCYVVLAEELHFGGAAERLYVAQPALSRSIKRLESLLGRALFVRTTRAVELTPAGRTLLEPAREVLHRLEALAGDLESRQRTLRVAHVPGSDTVALILDRLAQLDPTVDVREQALSGGEQLAALREGVLDVALCWAPACDRELQAHVVRLDPLLVSVFGRAPGERRPVDVTLRPVAVADGGPRRPSFMQFVDAYEREAGCLLRRVPVADGSGTEAYALRRAGAHAFVTLASFGVRVDCAAPTAPAVPVQAYYPWSVVYRRDARSQAVRAFLRAAEETARRRRWLDTSALPGRPWIAGPSPQAPR